MNGPTIPDPKLGWLAAGILALLVLASIVGYILQLKSNRHGTLNTSNTFPCGIG